MIKTGSKAIQGRNPKQENKKYILLRFFEKDE